MLRKSPLVLALSLLACSGSTGSELADSDPSVATDDSTENGVQEVTSVAVATSVLIPKANDVLKGIALLDASATATAGVGKVEFLVDGKVVGVAAPTIYGYILQWDTTKATDGLHVITSRATDKLGAVRTSAKLTVSVLNHPAQDPKAALAFPKQNEVLAGVVGVGATISDDTGTSGLTARLLLDGADVGAIVPTGYGWLYQAPDGSFGLNTAKYAQTIHTLQVVATDKDGNRGYSTVIGVGFAASAKVRRGDSMGVVGWINPNGDGSDVDKMKALGVRWVRVAEEWQWMSSAPGQINWSRYDKIVLLAKSRGMKVLALAMGAPAWANGGHTDSGHYPPTAAHYADFANFAAGLAAHGADAIEVWNEPNNLYSFWLPKPDVNAWAKMVIAVYPAVKKVNPNVSVITGGMTAYGDLNNTSDPNVKTIAPVNYLKAAMAVPGFADSFDGIGHHPYVFPEDPITANIGWNALMQTTMMHDTLVAYGKGDKAFWFTEFGNTTLTSSSKGMTEAQSAVHYQRYFDGMAFLRGGGIKLGPALSYTMYDGTEGTGPDWERSMGLFHADGSEKPAAAVVRKVANELW